MSLPDHALSTRVAGRAKKRGLITQSNYIPWKGYFDAINSVDEVILLDDVQYTRRDWRNRNRIKTVGGIRWLTIPVQVSGKYSQTIAEVRVSRPDWHCSHWQTLRQAYRDAPCFEFCQRFLEPLYAAQQSEYLSEINVTFLRAICTELGIETPIRRSCEFELAHGSTRRLVSICQQAGISDYYTGPAARNYLDKKQFADAGVTVHWLDYSGYPEYQQLHGPFEHAVSILDLLFHTGPSARQYMKSFS